MRNEVIYERFSADQIVTSLVEVSGGGFTPKMGQFRRWSKLSAFGECSGRGRAKLYTAGDFWRACLLDALSEIGLPPSKAVPLLDGLRFYERLLRHVLEGNRITVGSPDGVQVTLRMKRYLETIRFHRGVSFHEIEAFF